MGPSKIVFMFMRDCKWNKIPLPLKKGFGEVCGACLLEMPPHVEPAPIWQGPSPRPCAVAPGKANLFQLPTAHSSSHSMWKAPGWCGERCSSGLAPISKAGAWPYFPLEAAAGRRPFPLQGEARARGRKPSWNSQLRKGPGPRFCF